MLVASTKNEVSLKTSTMVVFESENSLERRRGSEERSGLSFTTLFDKPQIVLTVSLMILWPVTAMGYYGISLSMSDIAGNAFWSNALSALMEIPSYILLVLLMDKIGRRPLLVFSLLFTGLTCLGAALSASQVI